MAMRRTQQDILAPASRKNMLDGLTRGVQHAGLMRQQGFLSKREAEMLAAHAVGQHMEHMPLEGFAAAMDNGEIDKMHALTGYEDGEDPEEVEAERHATAVKVLVNFFADAASKGHISPEAALEAIQEHVDVPKGDRDDAIQQLLEASRQPDLRLPPKGGYGMSDDDVDAAIERMYASGGSGPRAIRSRVVDLPAAHEQRKRR